MNCSTSCSTDRSIGGRPRAATIASLATGLLALALATGCASPAGDAESGSGARTAGARSTPLEATNPPGAGVLIAVLPVENLTGESAPLEKILRLLRTKLADRGIRLVESEALARFMQEYRVRDTGRLLSQVSGALRDETGAQAYLVTSLESYQDLAGPVVSLFARLVLSSEQAQIVWMDGVALAGTGHPGLFGLGTIEGLDPLLDIATDCLVASLRHRLAGGPLDGPTESAERRACDSRGRLVTVAEDRRGKRRHRPRIQFRGSRIDPEARYTIALVPFRNLSNRNHAGRIVGLHFLDQMLRTPNLFVMEPGLVREQLLKYRIVMEAGPSLANAELISADSSLGVDFVVAGTVFDYQDTVGIPKVDFSMQIIDARNRATVWTSRSYNQGDEGVYFFDVGRIHTAHHLASEMARGTLEALARAQHSTFDPRRDPREEAPREEAPREEDARREGTPARPTNPGVE